jgi:DNA-binding response OmpR family regulator
VVDDEPTVLQTLRLLLTIDRHQIETAADGATALARFDASRHDLVITDYMMENMDGLELARSLRALCPAQPILLMTASLSAIEQSQVALASVSAVLEKPFSLQELRAAIAALCPAA